MDMWKYEIEQENKRDVGALHGLIARQLYSSTNYSFRGPKVLNFAFPYTPNFKNTENWEILISMENSTQNTKRQFLVMG